MAGVYIHIPFCKQACTYCNFHFSTQLNLKEKLLAALHLEIEQKKFFLGSPSFQSIYFGGGTPSILTSVEINDLLIHLRDTFALDSDVEITLEANPDDLSITYLDQLRAVGINRLSIGIQSFYEADMTYMHRAHTPQQSIHAVQYSKQAGFDNITIDLIYGVPGSNLTQWENNLNKAFELEIQHLSCYALTVEPKTILAHQIEHKKSAAPDEHATITQFEYLMMMAPLSGFEQYEISNFATPGFRSRHNSSYWQGKPYIGIGPSAHSYDGSSRHWNISNNAQYLQALHDHQSYFETERLDDTMRYNEYILTRIRTIEGIHIDDLPLPYVNHFKKQVRPLITQGYLQESNQAYVLTQEGKYVADRISVELFY